MARRARTFGNTPRPTAIVSFRFENALPQKHDSARRSLISFIACAATRHRFLLAAAHRYDGYRQLSYGEP